MEAVHQSVDKTFTVDAKHLLICQELLFCMKPQHTRVAVAEVLERLGEPVDIEDIQIEGMRAGLSSSESSLSFKVMENGELKRYKFVERKPSLK